MLCPQALKKPQRHRKGPEKVAPSGERYAGRSKEARRQGSHNGQSQGVPVSNLRDRSGNAPQMLTHINHRQTMGPPRDSAPDSKKPAFGVLLHRRGLSFHSGKNGGGLVSGESQLNARASACPVKMVTTRTTRSVSVR